MVLAWAITIHKSQGLTLPEATIDLGPKDFVSGLSFVAISRCKTLTGLAFRTHFAPTRLQRPVESDSMRMLRLDEERRTAFGFTLDTYDVDLTEFVFED